MVDLTGLLWPARAVAVQQALNSTADEAAAVHALEADRHDFVAAAATASEKLKWTEDQLVQVTHALEQRFISREDGERWKGALQKSLLEMKTSRRATTWFVDDIDADWMAQADAAAAAIPDRAEWAKEVISEHVAKMLQDFNVAKKRRKL